MKSEIEQIEKNALRLQSLLNVLKTSALEHESEAIPYETQEFLSDLANLCEIGKESANCIFKGVSELETLINEKQWIN